MTTNNDQQLIETILNGDAKSYGQLVNRYKDLVYTLAYRMLKHREEAEEVALREVAFVILFEAAEVVVVHLLRADVHVGRQVT